MTYRGHPRPRYIQEAEGEWRSTKTVEIMGLRIPVYFTSDPGSLHDYIANFPTKSDDVFIVSYPKSGNGNLLKVQTGENRGSDFTIL